MKFAWDWLEGQKLYGVPKSVLGACLILTTAEPAWCVQPTLSPSPAPVEFSRYRSAEEFAQLSEVVPPGKVGSGEEEEVGGDGEVEEYRSSTKAAQLVSNEASQIPLTNDPQNLSPSVGKPEISPPAAQTPTHPKPAAPELDLSPQIIERSPVLQRWRNQLPNVLEDIRRDPSFRTRLRLGYSQFPSTDQAGGVNVGVEDVFIGRTGLTMSADYHTAFNGEREAFGADLRYYLRPLGSYFNIAPVVGYRHLDTDRYSTDGLNLGARLLLVLSRGGAADISLTQTWVSPGSDHEVGLTTLSVGYALTHNLRLSTDIQKQNARERKDSRVGIVLEWMP